MRAKNVGFTGENANRADEHEPQRRRFWRSGRDSNPRYGFAVYSLSRRAPSTTRPPLRMHRKARPNRSAGLSQADWAWQTGAMKYLLMAAAALAFIPAAQAGDAAPALSPGQIVDAAKGEEWIAIAPSDRKGVVEGTRVSVRVTFGGR